MLELKDELARGDRHLVILRIFSTWSSPCRYIEKKMSEWKSTDRNARRVRFLEAEVEHAHEIVKHYNEILPWATLFFKDGVLLKSISLPLEREFVDFAKNCSN